VTLQSFCCGLQSIKGVMKTGLAGLDEVILGMLKMLELVFGGLFHQKASETSHVRPLE
jgi:hypothetical protein